MILVLDNYDSFTHNLARYIERHSETVEVVRSDRIGLPGIRAMAPEALVLSPGPCGPAEAGICLEAVGALSGRVPILGVCLGHQVIGMRFGGRVERAREPMHGRASLLSHTGDGLFSGLGRPFPAGRYHSLIVRETEAMARHLKVDALTPAGEVMALSHRTHPTWGIQFHPESVLTPDGDRVLRRFLELAAKWRRGQAVS